MSSSEYGFQERGMGPVEEEVNAVEKDHSVGEPGSVRERWSMVIQWEQRFRWGTTVQPEDMEVFRRNSLLPYRVVCNPDSAGGDSSEGIG